MKEAEILQALRRRFWTDEEWFGAIEPAPTYADGTPKRGEYLLWFIAAGRLGAWGNSCSGEIG